MPQPEQHLGHGNSWLHRRATIACSSWIGAVHQRRTESPGRRQVYTRVAA
jgi:hypothetical protein